MCAKYSSSVAKDQGTPRISTSNMPEQSYTNVERIRLDNRKSRYSH